MAAYSPKKAYLIGLDASISSREYVLDEGRVRIGRDGNHCDVVAAGSTISRQHAGICRDLEGKGGFWISDLGSTNGLFVNGLAIKQPTLLKDGDLIGLGSSVQHHLCFQENSTKHVSWSVKIPADQFWSIGRSGANSITLPFESVVSGHHAMLYNRNGSLELVDQDSLNGTWVNGKRVRKVRVEPSDTVIIGSTYFHFILLDDGCLEVRRRECGDDIQLDCVNVGFSVTARNKKVKKILDDITLSIKPGEFVGILGPSGAGKSTLLKAVNGYLQPTEGAVFLNETSLHHAYDMFRNLIGYVPQDDILHQELSVEKSLEYTAKLRLPRDLPAEQRTNLIDSTLEALGLNHVRHQSIDQLSGGQRKRVSIGAELLTKPSVLFLDEPTAGLDPCVEDSIMRHFKTMAQHGTTILITTHILYSLDLLDKIIVLSQGRLVFFGTPQEAMSFFGYGGNPLSKPIEMFDLLENQSIRKAETVDYSREYKREVAQYYNKRYKKSQYYQKNITDCQLPFIEHSGEDSVVLKVKKSGAFARFFRMFSFSGLKGLVPLYDILPLTSRHLRLRVGSWSRIVLYALIPVLLAMVTLSQRVSGLVDESYMRQQKESLVQQLSVMTPRDTELVKVVLSPSQSDKEASLPEIVYSLKNEGVQNLPVPMSVMVMCVMAGVFLGTTCTCLEISTEKSVYERERMSSLRIADYLVAKLPLVFLITACQCLLFFALLLFSSELWDVPFYLAAPTMIAVAWSSACLGLLISAVDPTRGQLSVVFAIAAVLPQLILSGGLGPDYYNGMSRFGKIAADCLPSRWGLEMMLTAIYQQVSTPVVEWIPGFIRDTMGFSFAGSVLRKGSAVLAGQAACWLLLTAWVLKRKDIVRG